MPCHTGKIVALLAFNTDLAMCQALGNEATG